MSGCRGTYWKVSSGILFIPHDMFSLRQISESGQCFRLAEYETNKYLAITGEHFVDIHFVTDAYLFVCELNEFLDIWVPYFDLDTNYSEYQTLLGDDPFLRQAVNEVGGIRMLRQDLWEMAVTFVISQRNNIPRIRKSVETLCREFGTLIGNHNGKEIYAFPTAEQLRGKDLSVASLGYRAAYIESLTQYDKKFWERLQKQSDEEAKQTLLSLQGVGEKVANCIMLFGLHRMNCYPRDVWINRLIDDVYHGEFDPSRYAGFAGYVQQLQFYYYRKLKKG